MVARLALALRDTHCWGGRCEKCGFSGIFCVFTSPNPLGVPGVLGRALQEYLQMKTSAVIGAVIGFATFMFLFFAFDPGPDRGILVVFSIMGALPVAAIAALFAAVSEIQGEIRKLRREVERYSRM